MQNGNEFLKRRYLMGFSATLSSAGDELTMVIDGRFDFNIHSDFRNAYRDLPASTRYVVDLARASFMDSSAMGMLLLLREHAGEKDANICLQNCNADIRKILSISNLDKMFVVE
jgi:HptB-dependent secretion and biofilm anti anti-sigma factor